MSTKLTLCDDMQNRVEVTDGAGVSVLVFRNATDKERQFAIQVVKRWNAYDALERLEVAANSVAYCYDKRPENFAAALQSLIDEARAARAVIAAATL